MPLFPPDFEKVKKPSDSKCTGVSPVLISQSPVDPSRKKKQFPYSHLKMAGLELAGPLAFGAAVTGLQALANAIFSSFVSSATGVKQGGKKSPISNIAVQINLTIGNTETRAIAPPTESLSGFEGSWHRLGLADDEVFVVRKIRILSPASANATSIIGVLFRRATGPGIASFTPPSDGSPQAGFAGENQTFAPLQNNLEEVNNFCDVVWVTNPSSGGANDTEIDFAPNFFLCRSITVISNINNLVPFIKIYGNVIRVNWETLAVI